MNPINNAENSLIDSLTNEVRQLRQELNDMKTNPQKIGNGSMNYSIFGDAESALINLAPGGIGGVVFVYMPDGSPFYYEGREAINRSTLLDFVYSVRVDVDNAAHTYPYGGSLSTGQQKFFVNAYCDYFGSGFSSTQGQRYFIVQISNGDFSNHSYYVHTSALIPRPALKPQ